MVYTQWMINHEKKLSDCKSTDIVWVANGDDTFEKICIIGKGIREGYVSYYKVDQQSDNVYSRANNCSCWYENPNSANQRLKSLTTEDLLDIFWFFDKYGLIRKDLCFDPEHFMETVTREFLPTFNRDEYIKNTQSSH